MGMYLENHTEYRFERELYNKLYAEQANLSLPPIYIKCVNIQRLFIDLCGVENTTYAFTDFPEGVELNCLRLVVCQVSK